ARPLRKSAHGKKIRFAPHWKRAPSARRNSPPFRDFQSSVFTRLLISPAGTRTATLAFPGSLLTHAAFTPPCIAGGFGRCANLPVLGRPRTPTSAFDTFWHKARPASRPPSISLP